ncbi:Alcohol dehydrogenase GroES-like domain-containing protein [Coniochaeta hoffmannii]|uniref:Alcohol dehydrogenase GroES-like domain-containing protein n=1 Tax=Coniochaeta hoffmannii TaxID=91930 RepID=A0AA38S0F1_9PEZI|nr:Alcohol dehydrogenase GroES-like domain-containing protein [Coniochaeta hoffmannii]
MSSFLPETFKALVLKEKGAPLTLESLPLKKPGPGEVLVKVLACGVCHSDIFEQHGFLPNAFPIVPGHEIIGDVAAVGEGVAPRFGAGDRVGGPWHGGHDGTCRSCRRARFQMCDAAQINGVSFNGGYAEYVTLRAEAVVRVPRSYDPVDAAPLLCAGVTVFNGMRKLHVEQGNLVAVQGLGGLGHLAVQYARALGYKVVAVSSGSDKRGFAQQLGAHEYIDSSKEDAAKRLKEMGGAAIIVCTAPNPKAMKEIQYGLDAGGKLLVLAPIGPVEFDTGMLVNRGASVHGWPSGHALDSEECLDFSATHGIKTLVERFPLADGPKAFEKLESGKMRFRGVLTME